MQNPVTSTSSWASPPLAPAECDRLIGEAVGASPALVALAVSGGADSMCLAHAATIWAREKKTSLIALIVDHGLRPGSADEAREVAARLQRLNVSSEILTWEHPPVKTRLHVAAREARYRLMTEVCAARGAAKLLTAHHRGDQAETILMRLAKGSGIDGLGGMRIASEKNGVILLRPFLDIAKERLTETCRANGIDYVDDPSNTDTRFARGRLRSVMPLLKSEGLTEARLIDLGQRARDASDALDHYTRAFLTAHATLEPSGAVTIDRRALKKLPRAVAARSLVSALRAIHDEGYPPEHASLMALTDRLLGESDPSATTLQGSLIMTTETMITFVREIALLTEAMSLPPGEERLWDGRWKVKLASDAGQGLIIRPLGNPTHDKLDALAPRLRKMVPKGRARASLPSLWKEDELYLIPTLNGEGMASSYLTTDWP